MWFLSLLLFPSFSFFSHHFSLIRCHFYFGISSFYASVSINFLLILTSAITDIPSPNKIRPMVSSGTFQITSRGRVAFAAVPIHSSPDSVDKDNGMTRNSNLTLISSMINYLSPEYVSCLGKNVLFNESDIEKVSCSIYFISCACNASSAIQWINFLFRFSM